MKQTLQKLLSLALCVVFVVGLLPMTAGAKSVTQYSRGDIIEFGWYPQTKVTDSRILAHLDAVAPAWESWTSYGYYSGTGTWNNGQMKPGDFMRYTDIVLDGVKYRGVKFTSYRPYMTGYPSSSDVSFSYQDESGYNPGNTYWFRFNPLRWRVLDPAAGLVLCETVIDSQAYNNYLFYAYGNAEQTHYANNYAESDIRSWLNGDFINTAFSAAQQGILQTTTLDNKAYSTSASGFDAESTTDKLFLLSYSDILNPQYGFSASADEKDAARCVKATDYAKCQSAYVSQWSGNSAWRLRTASSYAHLSCIIDVTGIVLCEPQASTNSASEGVRPACKFDLTSDILQSDVEAGSAPIHATTSTVTKPTCTEKGYTTHSCSNCEYTYTDSEVDALGHDADTKPLKEATCTQQAVCSVCGESYGELNPANHAGIAQWTTTATTHEKHWNCCDVTVVETEAHKWENGVCADCDYICAHTGGTATCTEKAQCEICGESYGELNPDNHTGIAQWTTTATAHEKHWNCCNATVVETEAHKWENGVCADCDYICAHKGGTATCTEKAQCEICGEPYGEALQHDYTAWTAATLEDGTSVHEHTCTRCGDTQTAPHDFTNWQTQTKKTFFEDGQDSRTCTVCEHTEYKVVYSTLHRILCGLEGFGIFLAAVVLSPFFWLIKTASPALYQQLQNALTGKLK